MKATIKDVAAAANVSIATVSRVLNNSCAVRENTRRKVYQAMEKVGYAGYIEVEAESELPREAAETGKEPAQCRLLLVVLPGESPFFSRILDGISEAVTPRGFDYIISMRGTGVLSADWIRSMAQKTGVCGALLFGKISAAGMTQLDKTVPVVQFNEYDKTADIPSVSIDNYSAGKMAVKYLLQSGYRRIAIINNGMIYRASIERANGFADAMREAGIPVDRTMIIHDVFRAFDSSVAILSQYLTREKHPDAIFACSDMLGAASLKAASRAGIRVPEDMAVVAFDDSYLARVTEPMLTAVRQPAYQMGYLASNMLMDRIEGIPLAEKHIILDTELLVRDSTAAKKSQ